MATSVLNIPLLNDEIAQYLFPRHLFNCILVSKQWNELFIPYLWKEIDLTKLAYNEYLLKNAEHVRSLVSYGAYQREILLLPFNIAKTVHAFSRLQSLQISETDIRNFEKEICQLMLKWPTLKKICLHEYEWIDRTLPPCSFNGFINGIKDLTLLDCLELTVEHKVDEGFIKNLITTIGRLKTLRLNIVPSQKGTMPVPDEQLQSIKESIYQKDRMNIENLRLAVGTRELEAAFVIPLVEQSEYLENLEVWSTHYHSDLESLANALADKKRLRSFCFKGDWTNGHDLDEFLVRIGSRIQNTGIKELRFGNKNYTLEFPKIIVTYYADTLTSLVIEHERSFKKLMIMLNGLPRLEMFTSTGTLDPCEEETEEIWQLPFACLNLRDLYIVANFSDNNKLMEFLFMQIGRLAKLKVLGIQSIGHFLGKEHGYLARLSELKELTTLNLEKYANNTPGSSVPDTEWMLDHWPKLDTIQFSSKFLGYDTSLMKRRRPDINLTIVEFSGLATQRRYI